MRRRPAGTRGRAGHERRRRPAAVGAIVIMLALVSGACSSDGPEVPLGPDGEPDPVLSLGRDIYGRECSACHGNEGQGGRGKKLNDGRSLEAYPEIDDMIAVIAGGKGAGMPAFDDDLDEAELRAVTLYVREVLN